MINKDLIAAILKTIGQRHREPKIVIHLPQEQDPAIAGECSTGKISYNFPLVQTLKE